MIRHFVMAVTLLMVFLSPALCSRSTMVPKNSYEGIAGHRIHKVLDQSRTGQYLGGTAAIFEASSGDYWLASYRKLRLYSEARNSWTTFVSGFSATIPLYAVRSISQTKDGRLWFGSESKGLSQFTSVTVFEDNRWKLSNRRIGLESRTLDFKNKVYACFSGRDESVWFAFSDQGKPYVTSYDGKDWSSPINLPVQVVGVGVFSGFESGRGQLWMGIDSDIWQLERGTGRWNKYTKPRQLGLIRQIFEDSEGEMWFADSQSHVGRYNSGTDTWITYRLADYLPQYATKPNKLVKPYGLDLIINATAICEDKRGQLFFGTNRGLLIFTKARNEWQFWTYGDQTPRVITALFEDKTGRVWVGTEDEILIMTP